jgi:hypothetical protein
MPAAFYLPLYHWFGLNPVPFHIAIVALLAVNTILVFFLARELDCEDLPAFLAALAVSYHAGLPNLQYSIAMVYDVLCCTFAVGAFLFYVCIRRQKRLLRPRELVIFFALFICALNSKEMALTLPLILVAYEWFYHRAKGARLVILFAITLMVIDFLGKRAGANPMLSYAAYQPVFTLEHFMAFQKSSLQICLGSAAYQGGVRCWSSGSLSAIWPGGAIARCFVFAGPGCYLGPFSGQSSSPIWQTRRRGFRRRNSYSVGSGEPALWCCWSGWESFSGRGI